MNSLSSHCAWSTVWRNTRKDKTWALPWHLLHENFKSHGEPFKVPNGFLDMIGMGRSPKSRGLRKLERLGALEVEHRANKSPIVKFKAPWGQRRHQN
jgi:hypothetical protein